MGSSAVQFGLVANLPNGAIFIVDLVNQEKSRGDGCDKFDLDPIFSIAAFSGDVQFAVNAETKLSFRFGRIDVDLKLSLPQVDLTLTGIYSELTVPSSDISMARILH